jgi:cytochrome P450
METTSQAVRDDRRDATSSSDAAARAWDALPRSNGWPLVGHVPEALHDPIGMISRVGRRGPLVRAKFGPFTWLHVRDPEAIQHILQHSPGRYGKSEDYAATALVVGNGLLTSEGDFWRRQRKLAQPAFHHARLKGFATTMARCADDAADELARIPVGHELDVHAAMMKLTLRVAGLTLFGVDLTGDAKTVGAAVDVALRFVDSASKMPFLMPLWLPLPSHRRFNEAMRDLHGLVNGIIESRRKSGERKDDLLAMLMEATDESGAERMSDEQLRDEVMTLLLAGHETTANVLSFTFHLLAHHRDARARLEEEGDRVLGGRAAAFEDTARLELTDRVMNESMRLYPPAWAFGRRALEDDVVRGVRIPKGTNIVVPIYHLHRDPTLWDRPSVFDPDRFSKERSAGRSRYAFIPFGDGPRVCIGKQFAIMEAKLLLASLARRVRFDRIDARPLRLEPTVTLRPRGGLYLRQAAR